MSFPLHPRGPGPDLPPWPRWLRVEATKGPGQMTDRTGGICREHGGFHQAPSLSSQTCPGGGLRGQPNPYPERGPGKGCPSPRRQGLWPRTSWGVPGRGVSRSPSGPTGPRPGSAASPGPKPRPSAGDLLGLGPEPWASGDRGCHRQREACRPEAPACLHGGRRGRARAVSTSRGGSSGRSGERLPPTWAGAAPGRHVAWPVCRQPVPVTEHGGSAGPRGFSPRGEPPASHRLGSGPEEPGSGRRRGRHRTQLGPGPAQGWPTTLSRAGRGAPPPATPDLQDLQVPRKEQGGGCKEGSPGRVPR